MMTTGAFEVQATHPFKIDEDSGKNYAAPISIRHSPPLTYENTHQHINRVDQSLAHDLPQSRHPGSPSADWKTQKLPLCGRSRPLPIPLQSQTSPAEGAPAVLSPPAMPAILINPQFPTPALVNQRRRPLPKPGAISTTATPSTLPAGHHLSSPQTSFIASPSNPAHSRSESSNSNAPSLCTTLSHSNPHSSSSYQTSFVSTQRASPTLPVSAMQHAQNKDGLALLGPCSAPPRQAAFNTITALAPRNSQDTRALGSLNTSVGQTESAVHGEGKSSVLRAGNKSTAQNESDGIHQANLVTFVIGDSTMPFTSGITTALPEIPSLPPLDFTTRISPIALFFGTDSELSGRKEVTGDVTDADNELGLSGMREESQESNTAPVPSPLVFQIPPPPMISPPIPPSREVLPTQSAPILPSLTPVSLQPPNGVSNMKKNNRPVLSIRTWDLDAKSKSKKDHQRTLRGVAPLPIYKTGNEVKVPLTNDQAQGRNRSQPSVAVPRRTQGSLNNSRPSFLPSMGFPSNLDATEPAQMVPPWGAATVAKEPLLLRPDIPAHLEPAPPKPSGGPLAAQLKRMRLLHRKSKSVTDWNPNGLMDMTDSNLQQRLEATLSTTPMAQSWSFFGHRHPYGFQRGAPSSSLTSIGASVPRASSRSMEQPAAPYSGNPPSAAPAHAPVSFLPSHQPERSLPFHMAHTLIPPESKKSIGTLWTKFRFGTGRKVGTAPRKKAEAIDLW